MNDERLGLPSASAFYRDRNCQANRAMAAQAKREDKVPPENEYTSRGTRIHELLEKGDTPLATQDEREVAERLRKLVGGL